MTTIKVDELTGELVCMDQRLSGLPLRWRNSCHWELSADGRPCHDTGAPM